MGAIEDKSAFKIEEVVSHAALGVHSRNTAYGKTMRRKTRTKKTHGKLGRENDASSEDAGQRHTAKEGSKTRLR